MKKILILLTILCASNLAQATLIDLTPGGINNITQNNDLLNRYLRQTLYDQALPSGWVNFASLNGGTYFFTDLIGHAGETAHVSWDMANAPSGLWMNLIYVFGQNVAGEHLENWYWVPFNLRYLDTGELVTIAPGFTILGISFYGRNQVPDTGDTLMLLAGALGCLLFLARTGRPVA